MAYLFKIEGKAVFPNEETLLIPPFNKIWERDDSKGKQYAMEEFAYMEFMTSQLKSNPYRGYDEGVRHKKIKDEIITRKNWIDDDLIVEGIEKIKQFQTEASPTYSLYMSTAKGARKLESFLNTVNLNERNEKTGNPVYKPKELSSAMLDVDKLTATLAALKKKVEEELFDAVKTKGQKEISPFANPNSLI